MKEVRETKLVEQTTVRFYSDDGKEFSSEEECRKYEALQDNEKELVDIKYEDVSNVLSRVRALSQMFDGVLNIKKVCINTQDDLNKLLNYYKKYYPKKKIINKITYKTTCIILERESSVEMYNGVDFFDYTNELNTLATSITKIIL